MQYRANNQLIEEQDENIEEITQIAQHLKAQGADINKQLQRHHRIAAQLDTEMDLTTGRLTTVQRKLGELLETDDASQVCTCVMMAVLCVIFSLCIIIF